MAIVGSTFRTGEPDLTKLLDQIHIGEIQLPDFQRGWVRDDDHLRSLIASISLSYPIGSVMLDIAKCLDPTADREDAVISLAPNRMRLTDFNRVVEFDISTAD